MRAASTGREAGFATIWVVSAMALVGAATAAAVGVAGATVERHRADAAADAAALATALRTVQGQAVACRDAAALARLNGATLTLCGLVGPVADVEVSVALPGPLAMFGAAMGKARAGPASMAS